MAQGSDQEKTERATPKKREEARERGQVAKSREIASTAVYLSMLLVFYFFSPYFMQHLLGLMREFLSQATRMEITQANMMLLTDQAVLQLFWILAPLFVIAFVMGFLGNVLQFGFLLSGEALMPKFDKLNVFKGIGKMFSKSALMELIKSIAKIVVVGFLAYSVVRDEFFRTLPSLVDMDVWGIFFYISRVSYKIMLHVLWFLILLSAIDYVFQRWQFEEDLKMTKQEVKDEYKQREGDPQVKARVRSIQREMARKRMLTDVPTADVVVTNPTHFAVALKYDPEQGAAPRVVAKGADFLAAKIREVAKAHGVPLVEDKPLARALYKGVKVGQFIPENLYKAVAEILAYVYSLKGKH